MNPFANKTAVISGGAEGIGLAIAHALGKRGMNIVIADINTEQLAIAKAELADAGVPVCASTLDVADAEQWQQVADLAIEHFGKVHMVVNNAGVGGSGGTIEDTHPRTWQWVVDVNMMGVVYGTQVMVPLIKSHGEGGWVVNVASMAGFGPLPLATPYTATKAAVVAMTENWALELTPEGIHTCVLCPGFAQTRIHDSERNMPSRYVSEPAGSSAQTTGFEGAMKKVIEEGMPTSAVAERLVEALLAKELYVFTHVEYKPVALARFEAAAAAFDTAAESPVLANQKSFPLPNFS
ncbi:MAG: SDR family NAD(P)-dependent oxidoreductase [Halieaceae bacterium]